MRVEAQMMSWCVCVHACMCVDLSGTWRQQAQQCDSWTATMKHSVGLLNKQVGDKEKSCKDEKKRQ